MYFIEKLLCDAVVRNYPELGWTTTLIRLGRKIAHRIHSYAFPQNILQIAKPSLFVMLKTGYAYAHYQARFTNDCLIKAISKEYFIECYFLNLDNAQDYFHAVYYPRYLSMLISKTISSFFELLFAKNEGHETVFKIYQIALEVFYAESEYRRVNQ
jgi:hypothetical protein